MSGIQDFLHKLEVGGGQRYLKAALTFLLLLFVFLAYNFRSYQNMQSLEAMDSAQLARNISTGQGYTTKFIRPYSFQLERDHTLKGSGNVPAAKTQDPGHLKEVHPDISNAPVYPFLLAAWMKAMPFNYDSLTPRPFWYRDNTFWRYQPDFLIAILNQLLMVAMLVVTWFLTRRLFDEEAAWIATLCLLGVELLWRFSVSGLSTMLLLMMMSGLFWMMHLLETEAREQKHGLTRVVLLSVGAGLLVGLTALTRYSTLWMIIPVVAFLITFGARYRFLSTGIVVGVFLLLLLPWMARNIHISGLPFGTATHAVVEQTQSFPEDKLQRSLDADVQGSDYLNARYKFVTNLRGVVEEDLINLGGTWVPWFFAVGLMVAFRNPATQRLRYFLLMALGTFVVVQALGKTQLSIDTPRVNSENLLILLLPAVVIYGVAFFLMLLDNIRWSAPVFRRIVVVLFVGVSAMSLLLTLAPPRTRAFVYPPYYPPDIQRVGAWMKENELMMSDVPWAVAWYGDRQCMWLTENTQDDFYAINDYQKPVRGLFLTPVTTDAKFFSSFVLADDLSWGKFMLNTMNGELPDGFPLLQSPQRVLQPGQLFLTDWARWRASSAAK